MIVQWLGHSCFRIEAEGYRIVLDPYADGSVPGLAPLRTAAQEVLCSHGHSDHNARDLVTLAPAAGPSPFTITTVNSDHDDQGGARRGRNTIHVLQAQGLRAVHLGDLGAALTPAQMDAIGHADVLMVPIGGYYTIDAQVAQTTADALAPTVVIPMHYRSAAFGYAEIAGIEPFLALRDDILHYDTDTLEVTAQTPAQTAVLRYFPRG